MLHITETIISQHFILDIFSALNAFILPRGVTTLPTPFSPAEVFYMTLDHPGNVAYSAIYVITTVIADAFLVRNAVSS